MVNQNLKKSLILLSIQNGKSSKKGQKWIYLSIIWTERISLLQVYFGYFTVKQGTIFKDICIKEGTQFCSACSSSGLIYYAPANWSFRRQIPRANHLLLLYTMKLFYIFFWINFSIFVFFAFWRKKIRSHLVKGVLL